MVLVVLFLICVIETCANCEKLSRLHAPLWYEIRWTLNDFCLIVASSSLFVTRQPLLHFEQVLGRFGASPGQLERRGR